MTTAVLAILSVLLFLAVGLVVVLAIRRSREALCGCCGGFGSLVTSCCSSLNTLLGGWRERIRGEYQYNFRGTNLNVLSLFLAEAFQRLRARATHQAFVDDPPAAPAAPPGSPDPWAFNAEQFVNQA